MTTNNSSADDLLEIDRLLTKALDVALATDESLLAALITEAQDAAQRRIVER